MTHDTRQNQTSGLAMRNGPDRMLETIIYLIFGMFLHTIPDPEASL